MSILFIAGADQFICLPMFVEGASFDDDWLCRVLLVVVILK